MSPLDRWSYLGTEGVHLSTPNHLVLLIIRFFFFGFGFVWFLQKIWVEWNNGLEKVVKYENLLRGWLNPQDALWPISSAQQKARRRREKRIEKKKANPFVWPRALVSHPACSLILVQAVQHLLQHVCQATPSCILIHRKRVSRVGLTICFPGAQHYPC